MNDIENSKWDAYQAIEKLSWWDWFTLWVEQDAAQLGIELTTYYMICSLVGAVQGLTFARCLGLLIYG